MNENREKWDHRAKVKKFRKPMKFCRAKGLKEPESCPDKEIARARKGQRGIFYVFCLAKYPCSCQSAFPKVLKIPIARGKGR